MIFALPSSPHWAPTTTVTGIVPGLYFPSARTPVSDTGCSVGTLALWR
jgi:hypothetical protein